MRGAVVLTLLLVACQPDLGVPAGAQLTCDPEQSCVDGLLCLAETGRCVSPGTPCVVIAGGRAAPAEDGSPCLDEDGTEGTCAAGRCGGGCGDGVVQVASGELCDLGAENSDTLPDRCREDCTWPRCGDGVIDSGESCDGEVTGGLCTQCTLVCEHDTADCNGDSADGCECQPEPLASAAAGWVIQDLQWLGEDLAWPEYDDDVTRIMTLPTDGGTPQTWLTVNDFLFGLALDGEHAIYSAGGSGDLWAESPGSGAVHLTGGVQAFALAGGEAYAIFTDGTANLVGRIPLTGGPWVELDREPGFPQHIVATDDSVLWTRNPDLLMEVPLGGGRFAVETRAEDIIDTFRLVSAGRDVYIVDGLLDVYVLFDGETTSRRLLRRPAALAGWQVHRAAVHDGLLVMAVNFNGESLDDSDDLGAVVQVDGAGRLLMRTRGRDFITGVAVDTGHIYWTTGEQLWRVTR